VHLGLLSLSTDALRLVEDSNIVVWMDLVFAGDS
jgi:hypothetical protein